MTRQRRQAWLQRSAGPISPDRPGRPAAEALGAAELVELADDRRGRGPRPGSSRSSPPRPSTRSSRPGGRGPRPPIRPVRRSPAIPGGIPTRPAIGPDRAGQAASHAIAGDGRPGGSPPFSHRFHGGESPRRAHRPPDPYEKYRTAGRVWELTRGLNACIQTHSVLGMWGKQRRNSALLARGTLCGPPKLRGSGDPPPNPPRVALGGLHDSGI